MKISVVTSLVLVALSLITIFGFVEPSSNFTKNKMYTNEFQTVVFLSKENASIYLSDDEYFVRTNDYFDISIRLEEDLSIKSREENKKALKDFSIAQTMNWEEKEISRVYSIIENAQKNISKKTPSVLQDTLFLIKTTGKENFDAYYTAKKAIVIPKTELKFLWIKPRKMDVMGTYVHEYMHIFTRLNTAKRNELYKIIGFEILNDFKLPNTLENRRITNPDFLDLNFGIKLKDSLGNSEFYTLLLTSKYDKYDGKKGLASYLNTLLGYADVSLYRINENGEVLDNPLPFSEEFLKKVGTISTYRYGADEIIAEAFQVMITENIESNSEYSERDKQIITELQAELKK